LVADDGITNNILFGVAPENYYIVIRHRNHLAIMSTDPVPLINNVLTYDFTFAQTQAYGTDPMADLGSGKYGMWAGDVNGDGLVRYNGSSNDKDVILNEIGFQTLNNVISGYKNNDVNMDGLVRYNGLNNDKDEILNLIGFQTLNNVIQTQVP